MAELPNAKAIQSPAIITPTAVKTNIRITMRQASMDMFAADLPRLRGTTLLLAIPHPTARQRSL
jgi:hypothetical protein